MSIQTSIPRRLRITLPENGYESPQYSHTPPITGIGTHRHGERHRPGIGGDGQPSSGLDHSQSEAYLQSELGDHQDATDEKLHKRKVGIRDRIGCYTWTWFTMTMATGGIANVLHAIPYRSDWLRIVGTVVFLFNLGLFLLNCFLISLRFHWNPGSFKASFLSQSESLFIPACVVS
ncbi:Malic acid transport protein [Lachnellula occidentalis]|uniref:Malic acid transport protein n=1 Tax=Lachnellula occidentalis TaxID=215460 RepID=A0A8H8UA04_9HELO|nr:Malic acid transport protein [Lachnellula occidentalis]